MCLCRTHCNAEVMSQKELCEERVAAAKHEVEMKIKKVDLGKILCKSLFY